MMAEQVSEQNKRSLGLVWLCCASPILTEGLIGMLEGQAWIHQGKKPPEKEPPTCVVLYADELENIHQEVKRLQTIVPDTPILAFGFSNDLAFARAVLQAGARGFIHAGMASTQIVRAILVASNGEFAVPRELLKELVMGERPVDLAVLTSRQQEILELVVEGMSNAQIARELYLSESTVKQHLRSAFKSLKVRNRTEAARLLSQHV